MSSLTIIDPLDAHLHLREGSMASLVTPMSARQFSDVIVMPNLNPPVVSVELAMQYMEELEEYAECNYHMALYLTDSTTVEDVRQASINPNIIGFKLYPMNATTGSENGISNIKNVYKAISAMQDYDVPLLIHGEVTRPDVDIFDREKVFIYEILIYIVKKFPFVKITLEHITTEDAVNFVLNTPSVHATITAHHLMINRNAIFTVAEKTALNPHNYCLPVAKKEKHRLALIDAATSGSPKFFAGTDSAPHPLSCKESSCGCAGIFTASNAIELYTTVFDGVGALDKLEGFMSIFGRNHYGIQIPNTKVNIEKTNIIIPKYIGSDKLTPFMAGETLKWKMT